MSINRFYVVIPARKNSKRIKNKNSMIINKNKRLIDFTFDRVLNRNLYEKVFVNSDDKKIEKICKNKKLIFVKRLKKNSKDTSTTESVILETIKNKRREIVFDKNSHIILLQCTSPIRDKDEIKKSINYYEKNKFDSMFSGYIDRSLIWGVKKKKLFSVNYNMFERKREQNMNLQIIENGSIYIFNLIKFLKYKNRLFGKVGCYLMSKINSFQVDEPEDIKIISKILK